MPQIIIVGLGNPGEEYAFTRHNVGFMLCDLLAQKLGLSWQDKPKWQCHIAQNQSILLVKPQTFMNASGDSVSGIVNFYQWSASELAQNLLVIHDDLDIELGQFKLVAGKGPKLHNGVNSIETSLKTTEFWRCRIGIDGREGRRDISGPAYVLLPFMSEENDILRQTLNAAAKQIMEKWKLSGLESY